MDQSLNSGNAIAAALIAKGGHGIMKRLAEQNDISATCISMTVHGKRKSKDKLRILANYLGQPVYGVAPKQD